MKKTLMLILVLTALAHAAAAKDVSYSDILANPSQYIGKTGTLTGLFVYSEPMKESFTIDQNGKLIEIFYRELPSPDKDMILLLKKYSKVPITITGMIHRFENSSTTYYVNASSLGTAGSSAPTVSSRRQVAYADILSNPSQYIGKTVTMKGAFLYSDHMRESFMLDQNGSQVEVFYRDLPQSGKDVILSQRKYSKKQVIATGVIQKFANSANSYFLNATSFSFDNE